MIMQKQTVISNKFECFYSTYKGNLSVKIITKQNGINLNKFVHRQSQNMLINISTYTDISIT